jgi:MFS family permease
VPTTNAGSEPHRSGLWVLLPGPLAAAAVYGVAEASLFSLFPVRMAHGGYDPQATGVVFAVLVAGSILLTLPVSRLGDRVGKTPVLRASLFAAFVGLLSMSWIGVYWYLLGAAFVVGGGLGATFALALSVIGDRLPPTDLPGGSALFTTAFSGGAALGPAFAGYLMQILGHTYLFAPTLVMLIVLVAFLGGRPAWSVGVAPR